MKKMFITGALLTSTCWGADPCRTGCLREGGSIVKEASANAAAACMLSYGPGSSGSVRNIRKSIPPQVRWTVNIPEISQGEIGSCTAFAVVNALELLEPNRFFSAAELYIRAKTVGGSDRDK